MEIPNKVLAVAGIVVVCVAVGRRYQTSPASADTNDAVVVAGPAAAPGPARPHVIQDSGFNMVPDPAANSQLDDKLGGTPNQDLIDLDQAGATAPAPNSHVSNTPAPSTTVTGQAQVDQTAAADATQDNTTMDDSDGSSNWANRDPVSDPTLMSDRTLFDMARETLGPVERETFDAMWFTMSEADRTEFLNGLRGDN